MGDSETPNQFPPEPSSIIQKKVDTYIISYGSVPIASYDPKSYVEPKVSIYCYYQKKAVAYLNFYDRKNIPPNSYFVHYPEYTPIISFRISSFNDIINILRHEKPIGITFHIDSLKGYVITGAYEPVGEQE